MLFTWHVLHMKIWCAHVKDGSNKKRAWFIAPKAEGESCPWRHVSIRLSDGRDSAQCRASICKEASGAAEQEISGTSKGSTGWSGATRARIVLIVVDSSAVIEVLFRSQTGIEIEKRIFSPFENLCAPHLLDLEIAQVLRCYCTSGEISSKGGRWF